MLGALAGTAGSVVGLALVGLEALLSGVLGLVLVAVGLVLCGVFHRLGPTRLGRTVAAACVTPLSRLVASDRLAALIGLGVLNGLLPCGLVYAMLSKAALTGSPLDGALTLTVFGLGTAPALWATGWFAARLTPLRTSRLQRLGGVLDVLLGLLALGRASAAFPSSSSDGAPPLHCVPVG